LNPSQAEGMEERSFIFSTGNETVCQGYLCLLTKGGLIRVIFTMYLSIIA
jgi:hypothetical protein